MPRFSHRVIGLLLLGVLIFSFVFGACSSGRREGEVEPLGQRVKGFWDARIAGDEVKAYNYESYAKTGKMTLQDYLRARNPALKYKAYEVKKALGNGGEATVTVDVQYTLVVPASPVLPLSVTIEERWVRIDGQWYRQLLEQPATG